VTLALVPSATPVFPGDPVAVDVAISGLGSGAPPTLAGFDLDITFDPSVLAFASVDFGGNLGIVGLETLPPAVNVLAGPTRVDLALSSLLPDPVLDASQPDAFVLATLHFTALGAGLSPLAITQAVLANTPGGSIAVTLAGTSVEVLVPEPGPLALLALLALGLASLARRRRGGRKR
jgi:hypothetical protein